MITRIKVIVSKACRFFSRSEWTIRLLGLSRLEQSAEHPGLVMIQIDGLSLTQFQRAIKQGHLPFLKSLLNQERYALHSLYSGLPSNTPAVQGELFYGIKTCVPAFSFVDHSTGQPITMMNSAYVEKVEAKLKGQDNGLLAGGSSYSNIFAGGADEAHGCWGKMGWEGVWHAVNPLILPFLIILYIDIFIRTLVLFIVEVVIAVFECIRGTLKGRVFLRELELIWLRALVCVFLREFITAGVCMDIKRGLPVIHLNFLGYDEQAHCRGPSSQFAHWSLQGIDDAIKRIDRVAKQSEHRDYDLWVYSDHGQEKTDPYLIKHGCTFESAIERIFKDPQAIVTAMGPLGHIYPLRSLTAIELDEYARQIVHRAQVPLVLTHNEQADVCAWTPGGRFVLPQQAKEVFGEDHPFLDEAVEDIMRVCRHRDAGSFVVAGWSKGQGAISFPLEYGAHAGIGKEETGAFALVPMDIHFDRRSNTYLRPMDLRNAAMRFMAQTPLKHPLPTISDSAGSANLRIMSYNVHGCQGMDGRISIERIARVIKRYDPDIVALQELDSGRLRSSSIDQAGEIARRLEMTFHFHPTLQYKHEQYGNAVLSKHPMTLIKKDALPKLWDRTFMEPRGAIWVLIDYRGTKINVINTHLSLLPKERLLQIRTILDGDWLERPDCDGPIILCGDLNMMPNSSVYKEICKRLKDSQKMLLGHKPVKTWCSSFPLMRLDHVFVSPDFSVQDIPIACTRLDRIASDHLPIVVDLSLGKGERNV